MTRLLITGGAGFIGSHVARAAAAVGHTVAVVALPQENVERIGDLRDRVKVLRADLEDVSSMHGLADSFKPEACIHLAWCVRPGAWHCDPQNVAMLTASLDLLEVLADVGCRHIVTAGSCAEYSPAETPLTEKSPEGPDTLYGACKLSLRHVGGRIAALRAMSLAHARIFWLYGPGEQQARAVPAIITALLAGKPFTASDGSQIRDYLHVADVASALLMLAEHHADGVFNVCSGQPVTMRHLFSTLARMAGGEDLLRFAGSQARPWGPQKVVGDNTRLRELGWNPAHTLVSGLSDALDWWRRENHRAPQASPCDFAAGPLRQRSRQ